MKTALIIGSTGLIGQQLLTLLLKSEKYDRVISFVRKDAGIKHPKLVQHVINFDKADSYKELVYGDDFFCTIGTTIKTAGSEENFEKVDLRYPQEFMTAAKENGIGQFLLVSSLGADPSSSNFYLRTKGNLEVSAKESGIASVSAVRPSLLLGNRKEFRLGESAGALLSKIFSFAFVGKLKKYKPIQAETVAKAMIAIAKKNAIGFHVYESDVLNALANTESTP